MLVNGSIVLARFAGLAYTNRLSTRSHSSARGFDMSSRNLGLIALILLAAVSATGCSPATKLVGKWQLDTSAVSSDLSGGNQTAAAMMNMMQAFSMDVEFKGDGNVVVTGSVFGQPTSVDGTWRYLKSEGDTMVLMMKAKNDSAEREVRVRLIDQDRMEMVPPSWASRTTDKPLPFKRAVPKK